MTTRHSPAHDNSLLARTALRFTEIAERWFPDSYIFVILAVVIVSAAAVLNGAPPVSVAAAFGNGFWSLITFTMQLALLIVTGYVLAVSPPVEALINRVAGLPRNGHQAIGLVAFIAMFLSLFNWAMGLIIAGLTVRSLARRSDIIMDYRAAAAAAYLGLGATWAFGIGSLSAQLQANADSLPKPILAITGVIPLSESVFLWPSLATLAIIFVLALVIALRSVPSEEHSVTAADLGLNQTNDFAAQATPPQRPAEWLEYSPVLTIAVATLGAVWLAVEFTTHGFTAFLSNLNTYNFLFLMLGMAFHWRPRSFLNAVVRAVPTVSGVLIQFPFFGSIAAILTTATNAQGISVSDHIADALVTYTSISTYPLIVTLYSTILGTFIPSGGARWVVAAPHVMQAAIDLQINLGWAVQVFNAVSMPLLINPFFMLPLTTMLGLQPRDIVGFTFLQFLWHVPVMLFLFWLFTGAVPYTPPVLQ